MTDRTGIDRTGQKAKREARRIVHVDIDPFYVQIEHRDFPWKYPGEMPGPG